MALNPDPRPGRWLLPLVVLGMVLFTYVFVNRLPGVEPAVEAATESTSTTGVTTDSSSTTQTTTAPDPALTAYREALTPLAEQAVGFQTEMAAVNAAWDADPKEIDAAGAKTRLTALRDATAGWAAQVGGLTAPVGLETQQTALVDAANRAAAEAQKALDGFVSAPGPDQRRAAAAAFDTAINDFLAAVAAV